MASVPSDRNTKESYLATLLMMAEADDRDHESEWKFMVHVAVLLGLTEQDLVRIDQHPENLSFEFPKGEQERMNLLYHLLFLMKIDGRVGPKEKALCHELGTRLGFNYLMVDELIEVMTKHEGKAVPNSLLLDIIKKYMN